MLKCQFIALFIEEIMQNRSTTFVHPFEEESSSTKTAGALIENNTIAQIESIENNPAAQIENQVIVANTPISADIAFEALKISTVFMFAIASALSLPIFIITMEKEFDAHNKISLVQKILTPLLPYLFFATCNYWLIWNNIGHRMNGRIDANIEASDNTFAQDPYHVLIGFIANITNFTTAFLAIYAGLSSAPVPLKWGAASAVGMLNYTTDLYTEVVAAFRKHVENKKAQDQKIAPFFKQKYAKPLDKYALPFGGVLRELLPIIRGILWTKITTLGVSSNFSSTIGDNAVKIINPLLGIMVYWSVAYVTRFELIQFRDNIKAADKKFEIENAASRSSVSLIRLAGKASHGHILLDMLKKLRLPIRERVNIALAFYALSLMAILQQALHTYVSNTFSNAQAKDNLLVNYCVGNEKAAQLAPKLEIGIVCVAATLGVVGAFAKSAVIHKYAKSQEVTLPSYQVASNNNDVEIVSPNLS